MLIAALRDMQWRKRRFVIAVLSTAIIFAMTLVLTGLANGFRVEARKTVDALGVDVFLVKEGASGPFVGATPFAPTELPRIAATPGVIAAAPLAYAGGTVTDGDSTRNADLFGAPENGPGMPVTSEGRAPSTPDEVAVSSTLGRQHWRRDRDRLAQTADRRHRGQLDRAGQPAQHLLHHGRRPAVGVRRPEPGRVDRDQGRTRSCPRRLSGRRPRGAVADLLRPLKVAVDAITIVAVLLWIVAALIVGSVIYLSALERLRDFAVFKAIGVTTRSIAAGLAMQSIIVALLAALVGPCSRCSWGRCSRCR